jgi:hypothetical protein
MYRERTNSISFEMDDEVTKKNIEYVFIFALLGTLHNVNIFYS